MNWRAIPWLELTVLLALAGAAGAAVARSVAVVGARSRWFLVGALGTAVGGWVAHPGGGRAWVEWLAVDELAAPLLPVMVLVHLLTLLGTAKSRLSVGFCVRLLLGLAVVVAVLGCHSAGGLAGLLLAGVMLPWWDLRSRGWRGRGYLVYMGLFGVLLAGGWWWGWVAGREWGYGMLLAALLVRGGIVPVHGWVPALFAGASHGAALLFVLPMVEVLAALRLVLPVAPSGVLDGAAVACLVTAVYGGGMAIVQNEVRRFYAHLCVSQTSLVLFAVMAHTSNSLTAALCLWISSALALTGLAFSVRALEARFGELSLREHHGFYEQVPGLAVCFLVTGLASVGFPGTIGFVPMELLISGSVEEGLWVSATLAVAAMLNGVAIMRAYFALFTGRRPTTSVSLRETVVERVGIVIIVLAVFFGGWFSPGVVASRHRTADGLLERAMEGRR